MKLKNDYPCNQFCRESAISFRVSLIDFEKMEVLENGTFHYSNSFYRL